MTDLAYYQKLVPLFEAAVQTYQAKLKQPGTSRAKITLTWAYIQRMEEVRDLAILGREVSREVALEMVELGPWVGGPLDTQSNTAASNLDNLSNLLTDTAHSYTETRQIRNEAIVEGIGRPLALPIEKQFEALRLFEEEEKPWLNIAQFLCNCGEHYHTPTCANRVSHQVQPLRELLKKYSR